MVLKRKYCVLTPFSAALELVHVIKEGLPNFPITGVQASAHSKQLIHSNCIPLRISMCVGQTLTHASHPVQSSVAKGGLLLSFIPFAS